VLGLYVGIGTEWEKLLATFNAWLELGKQLAKKIKEIREKLKKGDLSEEERKELEKDLERLEKLLSGIFGGD